MINKLIQKYNIGGKYLNIVRARYNNKVFYGINESAKVWEVKGDVFNNDISKTDISYDLSSVKLLSPVDPPNIIAIGLNYRQHAKESGAEIPKRPVIFLKATSSIIAHEESITIPSLAPDEVDYEGELGVVIGKTAKDIEISEALDYVLGYTCANDVSARDCQRRLDVQWARAKSFDTFCPVGPWITTGINPHNLNILTRLNGQIVQDSSTSDMIFSVAEIVSYCSKNMTLLPGTLILTGTPEGVGFARKPPLLLKKYDLVEIEIEGIGTLKNSVI